MRSSILIVLSLIGFFVCGCSTSPKTDAKKDALDADSQAAIANMKADDPSFDSFLKNSYGYVIFPSVGKGGLIVGGAYGKGQVYEQGKLIGYADISQATVGLQAGGQEFSELICFQDKAALDRFINQQLQLAAQASAVAMKSGAAANAKYTDGIAIFADVKGGLMAEASVGGQRFAFAPLR